MIITSTSWTGHKIIQLLIKHYGKQFRINELLHILHFNEKGLEIFRNSLLFRDCVLLN